MLRKVGAPLVLSVLMLAPAMAQEQPCRKVEGEAQARACEAAIAGETDPGAKAQLLYDRAYDRVEAYDYDGAMSDLDLAITLNPLHAKAYHERAYVLVELGEFRKAVETLDTVVRLTPTEISAFQERGYARFAMGDLQGALEDADRWALLDEDSASAVLTRARVKMWMGRFDEARADMARGLTLAIGNADDTKQARTQQATLARWLERTPDGDAAAICEDAGAKFDFGRANLIGDCSAAYLAATDDAMRAAVLATRGYAWFHAGDEYYAVEDMRMATSLEPTKAGWRSNLGYLYINGRHSWAAEREFDRSLALEQTPHALAGRAQARLNQREYDGAVSDARTSLDLKPNEIALIVLGDVAMHRDDDKAAARAFWLAAYNLGGRDDGLMERLRSVGVTDPAKEVAKPL